MNLLITGALGFVGVSLVRALAALPGVRVLAADLHQPDAQIERFWQPVRAQIVPALLDVTDRAAVRNLFDAHPITHVVHAAALTPTDAQERTQPTHTVDVNLGGALNILDAAAHADSVERLLLVSSSGVYGAPTGKSAAQREDGPRALDNLYAITKYSAELLTARYSQLCKKPMAAIRLGSIYGPWERTSASRPRTSQVGRLLAALRAQRSITVAGPDVGRDWAYAGNVAGAVGALLGAPRWRYPVYNVGSGTAIPFRDVVAHLVARGLQATWVVAASAADVAMTPQQARAPLNIDRLHADTGFVPRYSLADGLDECLHLESGIA